MGALLFQSPQVREKASEDDLTFALVNNYSYKQYCQLHTSHIPAWLTEEEEVKEGSVKEDCAWMTVREQDVNAFLAEEKENLREVDIHAIIEEETGDRVLQSMKSFMQGVSNVEGVDALPCEGPGKTVMPVNVDFDAVMDLLKGRSGGLGLEIGVDVEMESPPPRDPYVQPSVEMGEEVFEEEDLELDVLSNLLQSYLNQPSVEGPVQSMMASMGVQLPSHSSVCYQTGKHTTYIPRNKSSPALAFTAKFTSKHSGAVGASPSPLANFFNSEA